MNPKILARKIASAHTKGMTKKQLEQKATTIIQKELAKKSGKQPTKSAKRRR